MAQFAGTIPLERTRVKSFQPCESCKVKTAKVKVTLPVGRGVTHRLCDNCDPGQ